MKNSLFVFVGSGLGGLLRFGVSKLSFLAKKELPYATLIVNVLGSFLIGFCISFFASRYMQHKHYITYFAVIGFLGGFTTFSTFSLDALLLFERGKIVSCIVTIMANVLFSLAAVYCGYILGK